MSYENIPKNLLETAALVEPAAAQLTSLGDLKAAELTVQFQGDFVYTVDNTVLSTLTLAGSGAISQIDAMAKVESGATTGSTATLKSKATSIHSPGLGGLLRFTSLFSSSFADTEQFLGLAGTAGTAEAFKNGLMVGYDGLDFGFHRFANDTKTSVALADWDDPLDGAGASGLTINLEALNVWSISYPHSGAGNICLYLEHTETGLPVLVHTIKYAGTEVFPSSYNPSYRFTMWADNKATTEELAFYSSSYAYFIEGKTNLLEAHRPVSSSSEQSTTGVTTEVPLFTIRNKSTYGGKDNFVSIQLTFLSSSIEAASANNLGGLRFVAGATLTGSAFSDISTTNSVVELDNSASSIAGGQEISNIPFAGKNDKVLLPLQDFDYLLAPGESFTVLCKSDNSATMRASLLWKELF